MEMTPWLNGKPKKHFHVSLNGLFGPFGLISAFIHYITKLNFLPQINLVLEEQLLFFQ